MFPVECLPFIVVPGNPEWSNELWVTIPRKRAGGRDQDATMTHPDIMRARAKRLSDEAEKIEDPGKRLAHVLKAVELEAQADALERERAPIPEPYVIGRQTGGARENA